MDKKDRLSFKIGSLEWMNFFGMPTGIIMVSIINLIFIFKAENLEKETYFQIAFVSCFILEILTCFIQFHRLRFRTFTLNKKLNEFKIEVREKLKSNNWEIDFNNKGCIYKTSNKWIIKK